MVAALREQKQFERAVLAAQELTANLLYELTVIQKMDYNMAREIAREWASLPDEEDQPELSLDPARLEFSLPSPDISV